MIGASSDVVGWGWRAIVFLPALIASVGRVIYRAVITERSTRIASSVDMAAFSGMTGSSMTTG